MTQALRVFFDILEALKAPIAFLVLSAFALPIAVAIASAWVWLHTLGLPHDIRERRRMEIHSEVSEHIRDGRAAGYRPVEIALHVLSRSFRGIPDDICWSAAEHWNRISVVWTLLILYLWVRFILPRKLRALPSTDQAGLLFGLAFLLLFVFWAVSSRKETQTA